METKRHNPRFPAPGGNVTDRKIETILAKDATGEFRLWACRGEGKGCDRNRFRKNKTPCENCFGPLDEGMTLGELYDRLKSGDA